MLSDDITRHVGLRHALGFKYRVVETLLRSYARFAEAQGDQVVQSYTAMQWALQAPSPAQRRNRLLTIRRLARELHAQDPRHEVPDSEALDRCRYRRRVPHIYSPGEVKALIDTAAQLKPRGSLRPLTYSTLFALIDTTGLRVSEALALRLDDLSADGIVVRATKFRKSRLVPLHETAWYGLRRYGEHPLRPGLADGTFFVGAGGRTLCYPTVITVFLTVARSCGLRGAPGMRGPRLHDLRHTFAVRALEQREKYPGSAAQHMAALSTYLGHAHVSDTYWYLQATPVLLKGVARDTEAMHRKWHP